LTVRGSVEAWASLLNRIRGRSLDELRVRAVQALHAHTERFWSHVGLPAPRVSERSSEPLFKGTAPFLAGIGIDPGDIARAIAHHDPQTYASFLAQSEAAEQGRVSLLGHEPLWVGNPPRWHREALSGIDAPRRHWSRIDHLNTALVGDHKLLWELNRHQYLLAPAFCWLLERQQRRLDLIESHLESWLADNPPRQGVNWVSSLEVAYRAISWCWLLWLLREAPWRAGLRERLAISLQAHAGHIERYLSTYFSPNTHLTGEALGLFYLGTVLGEARHAARWRRRGAAILESALSRQVHVDGVYFELSTQYHRYTTEIYLHYLLLAEATGWRASAHVRDALAALFGVLRTVSSSAGRMPLLGDDDGGLLLPLDHRPPDDVRALLLAGAVALQRPDLSVGADAPCSYAAWLCGLDRTARLRAGGIVTPEWRDLYFAQGGLAVLRDGWDPEAAVAVIDAGPHGTAGCGHSHADALAMTLALGRLALLIDRGTFTYIGPERNEFRATISHNTLEIDGTSAVTPGEPFKWSSGVPARARGVVCASGDFSSFFGLATGHVASGHPSAHCRRVLHQRAGAWVVHDRGVRAGARSGVLRWQLAPYLTAARVSAHSIAIRDGSGAGVAAMCVCGAAAVRVLERDVSPRLGQRVAARCLELDLDARLEVLTIIVAADRDGSLVTFDADEPGRIAWSDAAGRHRVSFAAPGQTVPLPAPAGPEADLLWWVDLAAPGDVSVLLAAMPAFVPRAPPATQVVSGGPAQSGRMIALARAADGWVQRKLEEPRRG